MSETRGKQFYNRQVKFLEAADVDGLIASQYHTDAIIVSFDFQHKGHEALLTHFRNYLGHLGYIKLISTDKFTETDDSIYFEATVEVAAGTARVYDVFMLRDGKATHHFTGTLGFTPKSS
jgi:hypothetical protein